MCAVKVWGSKVTVVSDGMRIELEVKVKVGWDAGTNAH